MSTTFDDFLSSLLAFESGWDRERYDAGIIQDWQLDQWAGGTVESFFPDYTSWSQLTDAEWTTMAYQSTNSYGFVGYQFGEALLIDLGYYDATVYYGNGASTNTWEGTWTGKNGVNSLADFETQAAQEVAIREEFGHNLEIIDEGLAAAGKTLDDYLGTTHTYNVNGEDVTVTLSLTGILAGAHLRGAPAVVDFLLNGTVSADEYGTSIVQYVEQFGGYDSPDESYFETYYDSRLTGDEGLGTPADTGSAHVTADTADVVITWDWGQDTVVNNFDPANDTIFVDWFGAGDVTVSETADGVVFSIPSNDHTVTLAGVTLAELSLANFTIEDSNLAHEILALVGTDTSSGSSSGDTSGSGTGDSSSGDTSGSGTGDSSSGDTSGSGTGDSSGGNTGSGTGNGGTTGNHTGNGGTTGGHTGSGTGNGGTTGGHTGNGNGHGGTTGGHSGGDVTEPVGLHGTANVTKADATVVVTWDWGHNAVVNDFNPDSDTIFIDAFHAGAVDVSQTDAGVVIAVPHNHQCITLAGVTLDELSAANFTIMNGNLGAEILSTIGSNADTQSTSTSDADALAGTSTNTDAHTSANTDAHTSANTDAHTGTGLGDGTHTSASTNAHTGISASNDAHTAASIAADTLTFNANFVQDSVVNSTVHNGGLNGGDSGPATSTDAPSLAHAMDVHHDPGADNSAALHHVVTAGLNQDDFRHI